MLNRLGTLNSLPGDEKGLGLEGWFRIELFHALKLNGWDVSIRNKGPDLEFDTFSLELKASTGIRPWGWIRREGLKYPNVDCLFLGPKGLADTELFTDVDTFLSVGEDWLVGLLKSVSSRQNENR